MRPWSRKAQRCRWSFPPDEWDAIALNYTPGTTGNPKGVVYHHRGAYLNALEMPWSGPYRKTLHTSGHFRFFTATDGVFLGPWLQLLVQMSAPEGSTRLKYRSNRNRGNHTYVWCSDRCEYGHD
ncbi:MAG: hypothetical protein CM1200mP14_07160 [Gammaproteobacteria bacterium]|nr:MAG: hypothetical protein CM1200mP14_07160 [Gammaproteobacteria bacterium]